MFNRPMWREDRGECRTSFHRLNKDHGHNFAPERIESIDGMKRREERHSPRRSPQFLDSVLFHRRSCIHPENDERWERFRRRRSARYSSPCGDVLKFPKEKDAFALRSCRWFHNPNRVGIAFEFFDEEMIFRLNDEVNARSPISLRRRTTDRKDVSRRKEIAFQRFQTSLFSFDLFAKAFQILHHQIFPRQLKIHPDRFFNLVFRLTS